MGGECTECGLGPNPVQEAVGDGADTALVLNPTCLPRERES